MNFIGWKIKNFRSQRIAKELINERNKSNYKFEPISKEKAQLILASDVTKLREELHKGTLTS